MAQNNVVVLKNYQLTKEPGVHHRLVCMTGEQKGEVYYIRSNRVIIGRGDKADIRIMDGKASREHAELVRVDDHFVLTDLNSNNGLILNTQKVTQASIKVNDKIIIGRTVLKYDVIENDESGSIGLISESKGVNSELSNLESLDREDAKEKDKKKKALYFLVFVVLAALMTLDDDATNKKIKRRKPPTIQDEFELTLRKKQSKIDREIKGKLDVIFQRGIRELREQNYYRAINEFNLAKVISPNNGRASFYIDKANKALDQDIESYFTYAKRSFEAYEYKKAIKNYCAIIKLLEYFPENERRKSAEKNIDEIMTIMGSDDNESRCQ